MTLLNIPEVWLSYKWICVIYVYHGDIRALLRGSNRDIRRPGARFRPKSQCWTRLAESMILGTPYQALSVPLVTRGRVSIQGHPRGCPGWCGSAVGGIGRLHTRESRKPQIFRAFQHPHTVLEVCGIDPAQR